MPPPFRGSHSYFNKIRMFLLCIDVYAFCVYLSNRIVCIPPQNMFKCVTEPLFIIILKWKQPKYHQ